MSAFIVDNSVVDRALCLWAWDECHQSQNLGCEELDKLGREMLRLNVRAVDRRYGTNESPDWETWIEGYYFPLKRVSRIDALKALQCLIYQCSEGEDLQESAVYRQMKEREVFALREIVRALPEYDAAQWG
jgi:hypothetical protein